MDPWTQGCAIAASDLPPDPTPHPVLCLGGSFRTMQPFKRVSTSQPSSVHHHLTAFLVKTPVFTYPQKLPFLSLHSSTNNSLSFHFCLAQQNMAKSRYSCFILWNRFFHISWYPILYICLSLISSLKQLNRLILGLHGRFHQWYLTSGIISLHLFLLENLFGFEISWL